MLHSGLHKIIVCPLALSNTSSGCTSLPSYFLWNPRTVLFCGIKYVKSSHYVSARGRQLVELKHRKAQGARLESSDTTMQMALTIFGRACISPVSILFPLDVAPLLCAKSPLV
jgi:hypothetical protein